MSMESRTPTEPEPTSRPRKAFPYFYYDHFPMTLPPRHRYPRGRFSEVRRLLVDDGVLAGERLLAAEPEGWPLLELAHTPGYLRDVREGNLSPQAIREIGLPFSTQLVERARAAVSATRRAGMAALDHGLSAVIGGGTHHAFAGRGAGYCLFSDIAVAIRHLQRLGRVARVLIVDLDVHQGNGNASIFAGDAQVFTFSIHGERNWPHRKTPGDLDVALPDGTGDEVYLETLRAHLVSVLDRHQPNMVFYLAGADPLHSDRLGRLALTHQGLRQRDRIVLEQCAARNLPVAVTLGGGYGVPIEDTIAVHVNTVLEIERMAGNGR